jgi:hypothetical protein
LHHTPLADSSIDNKKTSLHICHCVWLLQKAYGDQGSRLTCAWYSTECALVSSQRCPSSDRTMKPDEVDVNCRFRCHGSEKLGLECTQSTLTTAFMKVSCVAWLGVKCEWHEENVLLFSPRPVDLMILRGIIVARHALKAGACWSGPIQQAFGARERGRLQIGVIRESIPRHQHNHPQNSRHPQEGSPPARHPGQ